MATVIESSRAFTAQIMTPEFKAGLKDYAEHEAKGEGKLLKLADMYFKAGGRIAHMQAPEGETGEDKANRLQLTHEWNEAILSGMKARYRDTKMASKEEAKSFTDTQKKDRHTATKMLGEYRKRFLAYVEKLEYPNGKPQSEQDKDNSKDKTEATGEKSQEQYVLEDLIKLRGHALKSAPSELMDAILTFTAQAITALGGSIE